jgi:hypothetical protein
VQQSAREQRRDLAVVVLRLNLDEIEPHEIPGASTVSCPRRISMRWLPTSFRLSRAAPSTEIAHDTFERRACAYRIRAEGPWPERDSIGVRAHDVTDQDQ